MESNKIQSLECGRVIAIFAILAMHCQMFVTYWQCDGVPWFGYIFNQATRFAVPLFFVISGYLIQPKLTLRPFDTLKRYCSPLVRVFIVWSIICLLMPFNLGIVLEHGYLTERQGYWNFLAQTPINSLLEGGLVHLWFLPALMFATFITALLAKVDKLNLLIPIAVVLYIYGVLAGSYQILTDFTAPFFTRNGPFFSTLLFAVGFMIRQYNIELSSKKALMIAIGGMLVHFSEAYGLSFYGQAFNANDFLFGTAFWGIGCFMFLLSKPKFGSHRRLTSLAKYVLPIYVAHLPMIIIMMNLSSFLALENISKDITVFTGSIILTSLLIIGLEKTPLYRWLFR
ncbi:fucose 4-O-acetylase [Vibrio sp. 10N.286.49.B3]|uniref:acyltransferase n=1 Tax=Vibrio sp. 10N.286.49.B3 TaxID=1880855 RepID=UPI000C85370C|nr:acyltransferase family protein [Vibrio sp. 10N.286.49.B3]PMH44571.1 fucose 4-O-acetylase [Vibrio sp. 10N.286.49.B3]